MNKKRRQQFLSAIMNQDHNFDGVFYFGLKSTGIFCKPSCPARSPNKKNIMIFTDCDDAIKSGFRACKRCFPLRDADEKPEIIKKIIKAIDMNPEKIWKEIDLKPFSIDPSTVRRLFLKNSGMTFAVYARNRRLMLAEDIINTSGSLIDAQVAAGYQSRTGFRRAYKKYIENKHRYYNQRNKGKK